MRFDLTLIVWLTAFKLDADCLDPLINIDYIGLGYDAFFGNPRDNLVDPGFRDRVIELTFKNVRPFKSTRRQLNALLGSS